MKKTFKFIKFNRETAHQAKSADVTVTAGTPEAAILNTSRGEAENNNNGFSEEIQLAIFSLLSNPNDLANASYVSKTWKRISETPNLWNQLGFLSQKDFNQRKRQFETKQIQAAIKVSKSCRTDVLPLVYILGDTDFQKQMFGKKFELIDQYGIQYGNDVFRWRSITVRSGSLILCQNKKSKAKPSHDIPENLDIALIAVKNKNEINQWVSLFFSRPTILLIFAIPNAYLKNFDVLPTNAVPLFQESLGAFYEDLITKVKQLRGEKAKKHCLVS